MNRQTSLPNVEAVPVFHNRCGARTVHRTCQCEACVNWRAGAGTAPLDLQIRLRDGKCRGIRDGLPVTGWCKNAINVLEAVRRRVAL